MTFVLTLLAMSDDFFHLNVCIPQSTTTRFRFVCFLQIFEGHFCWSMPTIDENWIFGFDSDIVAVAFSSVSCLVSFVHIGSHLTNYTMPQIQSKSQPIVIMIWIHRTTAYVVRILLICPVYAISSAVAMCLGINGVYAEVVRYITWRSRVQFSYNVVTRSLPSEMCTRRLWCTPS